ncbi:uncharacterized protein LOC106879591, partial [Argonauta hians]
RDMKLTLLLWMGLLCNVIEHSNGIIDMNIYELQYVSDHLTSEECKYLVSALQRNTWKLPKNRIKKPESSSEPFIPCLVLLLSYDQNKGKHKTFHELALRLHQIGKKDLAQKLSKMIFHKKAEDIKTNYLDNSFRKLINPTPLFVKVVTGEALRENNDEQASVDRATKTLDNSFWSTLILMFCVVAMLSLVFMVTSLCVTGCPVYIKSFYRSCAPRCLVNCTTSCYNFICNIKDTRNEYNYY